MYRISFRTPEQTTIFRSEIQGQISDGYWEERQTDIRLWNCEVVCNPAQPGINFTAKFPLDFTDLLETGVVYRMILLAQAFNANYNIDNLADDLREMTTTIFGSQK